MIILNERAYVEKILSTGDLGRTPMAALYRVAKYYGAMGCKKAEATERTLEMLKLCLPEQYDKCCASVTRMVRKAYKEPLYEIDHISINKGEMDKIRALKKKNLMRLAFTLLCIAKYHMAIKPESNGWIAEPDPEIFKLANISARRNTHGLMLNELMAAGLIEFSKAVSNTSIHVLFMDYTEEELQVSDMRCLGYQVSKYLRLGRYVPCRVCGELVAIPSSVKSSGLRTCCPAHKEREGKTRVAHCPDCGVVHITPANTKTDRCPACNEEWRRAKSRADRMSTDSSDIA